MRFLVLPTLLLTAHLAQAQTGRLTGQALDTQGLPIPFATVLLRPAGADTTRLLAAQAGDDGRFAFGNVLPGSYRLTVSQLGYAALRTAPLAVAGVATVAPALRLQAAATELAGVQVIGQKPLLEMRAGKLVVNVADSPAAGATALEALEQVPGMLVINNRLSLNGQEGMTVLLDGRPTRYTDVVAVLRDFPSSRIAHIEVLTQPGASHDAAGSAGVINIILKQQTELGTNASLSASAGYGRFGKGAADLDLNHRANKQLNVFGSYGYSARRTFSQLDTRRNAAAEDARYEQQSYTERSTGVQTYRAGVDYQPTDRQIIGVLLSGFDNRTQALGQNRTVAASGTSAATTSDTERRLSSYAANANYRLRLDTLGRELSADVDASRYESASLGQLQTTVASPEGTRAEALRNDQTTRIGLTSARADYRQPLPRGWRLKMGAKVSQADIASTLDLRGGAAVIATAFAYHETIGAGYAEAQGAALGLRWEAGLRAEWTSSTGQDRAAEQQVQRRYAQLFPSLGLERSLNKNLALSLNYGRRIDRPDYQDLNPSLVYLDPYTSQRGNPYLRPQTTGSYKLALTYQQQPFLVFSYANTQDAISLVTATADSAVYSTTTNLDRLSRYNGTLNLPIKLGKHLSGYAGVQVSHTRYDGPYLGATYQAARTSATAYGQLKGQLGKGFVAEASGYFQSAGLNGLIKFRSFGVLNLGLQRRFAHDRALLRLTVNDVFFGNKQRGTVQYQALDLSFLSYSESRQVRLSFSYQLGNAQLKAARKRDTGLDAERGRVKGE